MDLSISAIIAKASITPVVGDYFAAFVGEECRGTGFVLNGTSMPVYGREEGESIMMPRDNPLASSVPCHIEPRR